MVFYFCINLIYFCIFIYILLFLTMNLEVSCTTVCFQCFEIYAPCSDETTGKHAHALGTNQRCESPVPHHWCHYLRERNSMGHRACVHCSVGVSSVSLV